MASLLVLATLAVFLVAYRVYARYVGERIYGDRDDFTTPAHARSDGQDFVPTSRHILFGHHFTSIAGAAPIIGPCVAAYWGWAPALIWVVVGAVFMGAVHDFGALMVSVREQGRSIADISAEVVNGRVRLMFLCFVAVLTWLVLAVFAMAMAGLFVSQPSSVVPIQVEIVLAVAVGWLIYRRGVPALWPSVVALVLLYAFVWVGTLVPVDFLALGATRRAAEHGWIVALLVYSAVASLLPVWLLLQPRDFINSHQLFVGLALLFLGFFVAQPALDAPAFRPPSAGDPPLVPILFVTIACGAISGFHGLVSSGTTSKQLSSVRDARLIGYGSMLGEGTLALAATMAAVAGIGLVGDCALPGQGRVPDLSWHAYYDSWAHAGANKAAAFVLGGGAFLESAGFPEPIARTLMAVLVISFASTTLDTATRIQRFIMAEIGSALSIPALKNRYVATTIAVVPAMALALGETSDAATGASKQIGWVLWPIFGASNQMLAALTMMIIALYFFARKKPILPLVIPFVAVTSVAVLALGYKLRAFISTSQWLLATLSGLLLGLIAWMVVEGGRAAFRPH